MKSLKKITALFVILLSSSIMFSQSKSKADFSGKYQADMQFVQLIPKGENKFIAKFTGDCELTTKVGVINKKGVLVIPFLGENQEQHMFIERTKNQIKIWNSDNSPMMAKCNGATLAGTYEKRE